MVKGVVSAIPIPTYGCAPAGPMWVLDLLTVANRLAVWIVYHTIGGKSSVFAWILSI